VRLRLDKLGALVAGVTAAAVLLPFAVFSANRIVAGEPRDLLAALPPAEAALLLALMLGAACIALLRVPASLRLAASAAAVAGLMVMAGRAGTFLTPPGDSFARVSPGSGFWLGLFGFSLMAADALTRLALAPGWRVAGLVLVISGLAWLLGGGGWDDLSILREYQTRADAFWREGRRHVLLAFGSLAAATLTGVPLGVLLFRSARLRAPVLGVLNVIQTIPSIALFGLLIAPLAWVAATLPGASALGIAGIGAAPALVALYAYSLLPVVANTVAGLDGVPRQARDAAAGMGMTGRQRLMRVEAPLAFPVILTGIRIVLVQNIGLATIAALIGGGGFGVFVFQGMGQTATDLILLGAIPTVFLAFAAAVLLDAAIEMSAHRGAGVRTA
jgi:osmoprotectant transport system permease protein